MSLFASLTLPLFTEMPVPSQESEQSCILCVRYQLSILPLSIIILLDYRIVPSVWYLLFIELYHQCGIFYL